MKHALLFSLFLALAGTAFAQTGGDSGVGLFSSLDDRKEVNVKIYPNPASSYIGLDNAESVTYLVIYNMVGRQVKQFEVGRQDAQYYVGDLPTGMYLVQMLDRNNQILSTKRLNKR